MKDEDVVAVGTRARFKKDTNILPMLAVVRSIKIKPYAALTKLCEDLHSKKCDIIKRWAHAITRYSGPYYIPLSHYLADGQETSFLLPKGGAGEFINWLATGQVPAINPGALLASYALSSGSWVVSFASRFKVEASALNVALTDSSQLIIKNYTRLGHDQVGISLQPFLEPVCFPHSPIEIDFRNRQDLSFLSAASSSEFAWQLLNQLKLPKAAPRQVVSAVPVARGLAPDQRARS